MIDTAVFSLGKRTRAASDWWRHAAGRRVETVLGVGTLRPYDDLTERIFGEPHCEVDLGSRLGVQLFHVDSIRLLP